jgi:hypothetical protein
MIYQHLNQEERYQFSTFLKEALTKSNIAADPRFNGYQYSMDYHKSQGCNLSRQNPMAF